MRITRSATGAKRKSLAAALRQGPNAPVKLRCTASRRGRAPARSTSGKQRMGVPPASTRISTKPLIRVLMACVSAFHHYRGVNRRVYGTGQIDKTLMGGYTGIGLNKSPRDLPFTAVG